MCRLGNNQLRPTRQLYQFKMGGLVKKLRIFGAGCIMDILLSAEPDDDDKNMFLCYPEICLLDVTAKP